MRLLMMMARVAMGRQGDGILVGLRGSEHGAMGGSGSALRRRQDLTDAFKPLLVLPLLLEAELLDTLAQLMLVVLQQRVELLEL